MQIIEFYNQLLKFIINLLRALPLFYGQFNRATEAVIRAIVTKLRTKFTLFDIKPSIRRELTEENIAALSACVNDDHQLSIREL